MCTINDYESNRILETTNLGKFELPTCTCIIGSREQFDDSSQESTVIGLASTMDTGGSLGVELSSGLDLAMPSLSFPCQILITTSF